METAEFLKCTICFDTYVNPRTLPCLHSFCHKCLKQHIEIHCGSYQSPLTGVSYNYLGTIPCPTCREEFTVPSNGVDGFRHDFRMSQFQDWYNEQKSARVDQKKSDSCDICRSKSSAALYCKNCKRSVCLLCHDQHNKSSDCHLLVPYLSSVAASNSKHGKLDIGNFPDELHCRVHQDETLNQICMDCNTGICSLCLINHHSSHNVKDLKTGLSSFHSNLELQRQSLQTRVSQLNQYVKDLDTKQKQLRPSKVNGVKEVRERSGEIIAQIKEQERSLLDEIDRKYKADSQNLSSAKGDLELAIASMESMGDFTSDLLHKKPSLYMVPIYEELIYRMDKLLEESLSLRINPSPTNWQFSPSRTRIKLGKMKFSEDPQIGVESLIAAENNNNVSSVLTDSDGNFRIQATAKIGHHGNKPGEFDSPRDVTFLHTGKFVVADTGNNRLQVFNINGSLVSVLAAGKIKPWGVTTTLGGDIAVADALEKCIKIFSVGGMLLKQFGQFLCPCGITSDHAGNLLVTDFFSTSVYILSLATGDVLRQFDFRDRGDRHASGASRIAITSNGYIVISDISNASIKVFTKSGKYLSKIADPNILDTPHGVSVDVKDQIYVADMTKQQVSIFSMSGRFKHHLFPDGWGLQDPLGLAINPASNTLLITEGRINQVGVYSLNNDQE